MKTMKNQIYILIFLLIGGMGYAQKKPKIKGDKEVVVLTETINETFNHLEVDGPFSIIYYPSQVSKYELETDANLSDIIIVKVQAGVLRVYSTHRIKKFKELQLTLYGPSLEGIQLKNDAEIETKGLLEGDLLFLETFDNSQFDLDLAIQNLSINMKDRSKGKISTQSETVEINMTDRTDIKADISTRELAIVLQDNADLKMKGDSNTALYILNDAVNLKAQDMSVREVVMNASNNADVYLHASKDLEIFAKGKSTIYLYGQPSIKVKGLGDQAKLIKKN